MIRTLFISPDYTCNERCIFCPCARNAQTYTPLTLEEMQDSVDSAIDRNGIEMVLVSGGEPTMWKNLIPFLRYVQSHNLKFGILSNSIKFASQNYLDRFLQAVGSDFELTTAFHSCVPEEHDRITGLPNSFHKSLQGIKMLIEAKVHVTIKYNINNLTYTRLPEYSQWLYDTFPDTIPWVLCNIDICGNANTNRDCTAVGFDTSRPYLEKALDAVIAYNKTGRKRVVAVYNTPLCCVDPYYWTFLKQNESSLLPALRLPYRTSEENRLLFDVRGDGGAIFPMCQQCILQRRCPGTWSKTGELYADHCFHPFQSSDNDA